jgi:Tol biopolymer transport system component
LEVHQKIDLKEADYDGPVWSPDGTKILFGRKDDDGAVLAYIDLETKKITNLISTKDRNARYRPQDWK